MRRRRGDLWRGLGTLGLTAALVVAAAACSSSRIYPSKPPVTGASPSQPQGVRAYPTGTPLDPALVDEEIRRRELAIAQTRAHLAEILSDSEKEPLFSWIRTTEEQVQRLRSLHAKLLNWPSSPQPDDEIQRNQVAAQLLEILRLDPLESSLPVGALAPPVIEQARVSWEPVRAAYKERKCPDALARYDELAVAHPTALVPTDVKVICALCLHRTGRQDEAIQTLEPLVMERAQLLDVQHLQYNLASWLFQQGLLQRSRQTYTALLQGMTERERWAELAKIRLDQIQLRLGESSVAEAATLNDVPPDSGSQQALQTGVSDSTEGPPYRVRPQDGTRISDRPSSEIISSPSILQVRASRLEEAQSLLESEEYEEAIAVYQGLLGTEYEAQAQEGMQLAQDRYTERRRRKAAEFVLKARRETNTEKRKTLLVQALDLLQETNARYPGNSYAAKIDRNIQDVIGQVRKIDPTFQSFSAQGQSEHSQSALEGPSQP